MVHNYKLVQRFSKPGDLTSPKKWYAIAQSTGSAGMSELCMLIAARSTVSSADVKAVLDNLIFVIDFQLKSGRTVRLGELGSFRLSVSSKGVNDKEDFTSSLLKAPKIIFTPGAALRETRLNAKFTLVSEKTEAEDEESENNGGETGGSAEI